MRIKILDEANLDLYSSVQFYENQSPGLGMYFLDTLFSDIEALHVCAGLHIQFEGFHRLLSNI